MFGPAGLSERQLIWVLLIALVVTIGIWRAIREVMNRVYVHRERMRAMEQGLVKSPEELEQIAPYTTWRQTELRNLLRAGAESSPWPGYRSVRTGVVWILIGLGLIVGSYVIPGREIGPDFQRFLFLVRLWSMPAIFAGFGIFLFGLFQRGKEKSS